MTKNAGQEPIDHPKNYAGWAGRVELSGIQNETKVLELAKEKFSGKNKLEEISRALYRSCLPQGFGWELTADHFWEWLSSGLVQEPMVSVGKGFYILGIG